MTTREEILAKEGAEATQLIIDALCNSEKFEKLSRYWADKIETRDCEDEENIAKGIADAVMKGDLTAPVVDIKPTRVQVDGKTPREVASEVVSEMLKCANVTEDFAKGGGIVTVEGLSGTGKSTTVKALKEMLNSTWPSAKVYIWSNGVVFRSLTLLLEKQAELNNSAFEDEFQRADWTSLRQMLKFTCNKSGEPDLKISGHGLEYWTSEIKGSELKRPFIEEWVSTVGKETQGHAFIVYLEAQAKLSSMGYNHIVEGRMEPVNRIDCHHKFQLVLAHKSVIGPRQAAMRVHEELHRDSELQLSEAVERCLSQLA